MPLWTGVQRYDRPSIHLGRKSQELIEDYLITKCENKDREISILKEEADKLTDYAVDIRYPEEPFEPTLEEAKEAFEITGKMKGFVLSRMALE